MRSASAIAGSGLEVAALGLDVSANNVANSLTDGFVPSRLAPEATEGGGVSAAVQAGPDPLSEVRADRALLAPSQVDLSREMVNQSQALAVYRSNLATLRTSQEMDRELTEELSG
ncbi:MAG TPA: hypothetical protein VFG59_08935 [Anaeromyxobacter sp.]|nr:hypothetical protein [Anaeromyxobacter sp.]